MDIFNYAMIVVFVTDVFVDLCVFYGLGSNCFIVINVCREVYCINIRVNIDQISK